MIKLKTTLLIFYNNSPLDGYICLNEDDSFIKVLVENDCHSLATAKNLFKSITGLSDNWKGIKFNQTITTESFEDGDKIIDIGYMVLLEGGQNLNSGFKWVSIKDLTLPPEQLKLLIDILSRRF